MNDARDGCVASERFSPSLAFAMVAQAVDRSRLIVRAAQSPDVSRAQDDEELQSAKPHDGAQAKKPQADYYPTAWFRN